MKKVIINKDKCIGCFDCMSICYNALEEDKDGKVKVRKYAITEAERCYKHSKRK